MVEWTAILDLMPVELATIYTGLVELFCQLNYLYSVILLPLESVLI